MSYFEILCKGSEFHRVDRKSDRSIAIYPAEDSDDDWLRFQEIVAEAEENAGDEYEILPHTNRMRDLPGWPAGRPVYDMAAITLI
jgi:hypothetical protein